MHVYIYVNELYPYNDCNYTISSFIFSASIIPIKMMGLFTTNWHFWLRPVYLSKCCFWELDTVWYVGDMPSIVPSSNNHKKSILQTKSLKVKH